MFSKRLNPADETSRIRKQISRAEFEEFAKKDRLEVWRESRDMEPQGSQAYKLYDELIATEILSRAKEAQAKELARQSKESEVLHYRRAALMKGPTRAQRFKWWLGDRFRWLRVVPQLLIDHEEVIFFTALFVSASVAVGQAVLLESGTTFWLSIVWMVVLFMIALIISDLEDQPASEIYDLVASVLFICIAIVPFIGFLGSGPGYYAIVVRDHGQVVRAEHVSFKHFVRSPRWSQTMEWYDLRKFTYEIRGAFDHNRGVVTMTYDYRIKFDGLAAGYRPDDQEVKRIGNEIYTRVQPVLAKANTLDELKAIPKLIDSIQSPIFTISNSKLTSAGYDLLK